MSVLVSDRTESKFEAITYSIELHDMLIDLMQRSFGVKNEEITYENVENMFRGWMGSFYKLLSKEQRKNLIGLYEDLFEKSITIISKRMIITDKIK